MIARRILGLIVLSAIVTGVIIYLMTGCSVQAASPKRFELLLDEKQDAGKYFKVYHDRESGQEFTCLFSGVDLGWSVSCFPTGRNWK